jgi:hypothetical protein
MRDARSLTISGAHAITNVSGGLVKDLSVGSSAVVHSIQASNMKVTLESNGAERTWNANRKRTISRNLTGYEVKIEANTSDKIVASGTNRKGDPFTTKINEPIVINSCNAVSTDPKWNVIAGVKQHNVNNKEITTTYGYDDSKTKVSNCEANTIKINYEGPRASIETFYTYK